MRGAKREFISRSYNLILRRTLAARFSDAQCGFKAIRRDVAQHLLPLVEDTGWFFDTELLVLAERCGLRIAEVPVDWVDDPDSRVDIVATARGRPQGRGPARPRAGPRHRCRWPPCGPSSAAARWTPSTDVPGVPAGLTGQAVRFAAVGVGEHGRLPGAVPAACAARSAPSRPTCWPCWSPRSPTPRPTGG